mmetsp:Transcript_26103/g.64826  ORF Transcript_26103/g.64826 Transcript_26103/m.64826 type:complete len:262 (+) Transcript_26103:2654-3439(+)
MSASFWASWSRRSSMRRCMSSAPLVRSIARLCSRPSLSSLRARSAASCLSRSARSSALAMRSPSFSALSGLSRSSGSAKMLSLPCDAKLPRPTLCALALALSSANSLRILLRSAMSSSLTWSWLASSLSSLALSPTPASRSACMLTRTRSMALACFLSSSTSLSSVRIFSAMSSSRSLALLRPPLTSLRISGPISSRREMGRMPPRFSPPVTSDLSLVISACCFLFVSMRSVLSRLRPFTSFCRPGPFENCACIFMTCSCS